MDTERMGNETGDEKLRLFLATKGRFLRAISAEKLRRELGREKKTCTWCGQPVPKYSRTWCSRKCIEEFTIRTDVAKIRKILEERTGGHCERCGKDCHTPRLLDRYRASRRHPDRIAGGKLLAYWRVDGAILENARGKANRKRHKRLCRIAMLQARRAVRHLWEADHVLPVVEGGGLCGPDGYRLLCLDCHSHVTRRLWGRIVSARKKRKNDKTS